MSDFTATMNTIAREQMNVRRYESIARGGHMDISDMSLAAHALHDEGFTGEGVTYSDAAEALAWRRESTETGTAAWESLCLAEGLARQLS